MKQFALVLLITSLTFGCSHPINPIPRITPRVAPTFFVSGVYACFDHFDYCRVWDTLTITKDRFQVYHILRRTSFQRNLEDVYYRAEKECKAWLGTYDPVKGEIKALDDGLDLTFHTQTNTLSLDDHLFSKIE